MGKWADRNNPTDKEASGSLGVWGQFDPFRQGDAAKFEWAGGNESLYGALDEHDRAELKRRLESPGQYGMNWVGQRQGAGAANNPTAEDKAYIDSLYSKYGIDPTTGAKTTFAPAATSGSTPITPNSGDGSLYAQLLKQSDDAGKFQVEQRLDPTWSHREDMLRTRLLNQGLDPSSQAYAQALESFGRDRNDAYSAAINQGQSQRFGNALNSWMAETNAKMGFANQQQANAADYAQAMAQLGPTAIKTIRSLMANGSSDYSGAVGYDASGTPYYSDPSEWGNPFGGY